MAKRRTRRRKRGHTFLIALGILVAIAALVGSFLFGQSRGPERVQVVTPTPDLQAIELAKAHAESTAIIALAQAEATMESVKEDQEARLLAEAGMTATSAAATLQPLAATQVSITPMPAVTDEMAMATPTAVEQEFVRILVFDDEASIRNDVTSALPGAYDVVSTNSCEEEVYDVAVIDGAPGGPECVGRVLDANPNVCIVGYARNGVDEVALGDAAGNAPFYFIYKTDTQGVVDAVAQCLQG